MSSHDRSQRRLLPHTYSQRNLTHVRIRSTKQTFPIQGSTLRTKDGPKNFYKINKNHGGRIEETRCLDILVNWTNWFILGPSQAVDTDPSQHMTLELATKLGFISNSIQLLFHFSTEHKLTRHM